MSLCTRRWQLQGIHHRNPNRGPSGGPQAAALPQREPTEGRLGPPSLPEAQALHLLRLRTAAQQTTPGQTLGAVLGTLEVSVRGVPLVQQLVRAFSPICCDFLDQALACNLFCPSVKSVSCTTLLLSVSHCNINLNGVRPLERILQHFHNERYCLHVVLGGFYAATQSPTVQGAF